MTKKAANLQAIMIMRKKIMKKKFTNKTLKKFSLSNYTLAELERLADEYDTSMSAIVEMAVYHFSCSQKKGI